MHRPEPLLKHQNFLVWKQEPFSGIWETVDETVYPKGITSFTYIFM